MKLFFTYGYAEQAASEDFKQATNVLARDAAALFKKGAMAEIRKVCGWLEGWQKTLRKGQTATLETQLFTQLCALASMRIDPAKHKDMDAAEVPDSMELSKLCEHGLKVLGKEFHKREDLVDLIKGLNQIALKETNMEQQNSLNQAFVDLMGLESTQPILVRMNHFIVVARRASSLHIEESLFTAEDR